MKIVKHLNRHGKWEGIQGEEGEKILYEKVEYGRRVE